jgi:hypothetical protein
MKFMLIGLTILALVLGVAYVVFEGDTGPTSIGGSVGSSNDMRGFKIP